MLLLCTQDRSDASFNKDRILATQRSRFLDDRLAGMGSSHAPSPSASGVRLCRTRTCYPLPRGERKGPQRPSSAAFSFCQPGPSRFVILGLRACPPISPLAGETPRQGQRGVTPRARMHRFTPLCHFVTSPPQGGRLDAAAPLPTINPPAAFERRVLALCNLCPDPLKIGRGGSSASNGIEYGARSAPFRRLMLRELGDQRLALLWPLGAVRTFLPAGSRFGEIAAARAGGTGSEPCLSLCRPGLRVGGSLPCSGSRRVTVLRETPAASLKEKPMSAPEGTDKSAKLRRPRQPGTDPARRHAWRCIRAGRDEYGGGFGGCG